MCTAVGFYTGIKWFRTIAFTCALVILAHFTSLAQLPRPDHIVFLIEENQAQAYIIGNQNVSILGVPIGIPSQFAPYINQLANDSMTAMFTNMLAIEHPSQPNYFDLFAGGNQGVTDDNLPSGYPFTTDNLAYELLSTGHSFVTYSPELPSIGSDIETSGGYARKHNPVADWVGSGTNQVPDTCNQTFETWPTDFNNLPTVAFVVPTEDSDMHNNLPPATVTIGDYWFKQNLSNFINWVRTSNTLFIFTFDEDDGFYNNNIPTFFFGPMVKHGTYNDSWNLYNLLRTVEDMYGLGHAGAAAQSVPIVNCWLPSYPEAIHPVSENSLVKVAPNPASTLIRFEGIGNNSEQAQISISDITGRITGTFTKPQAQNLEVNISAYSPGLYFYRVEQVNGVLQTGKFIVAR